MADDAATIESLRSELRELRALLGGSRADNDSLRAENAALAVERSEAIEQQTAMVDILQRIVGSQGDADSVLTTIAEHATRISRAVDTQIFRRDGDQVYFAGHFGALTSPDTFRLPWPLRERRFVNEVIRQGRVIQVADIAVEAEEAYPDTFTNALRAGLVLEHRTWLGVPLRVGSEIIGALTIRRATVSPFSARQIAVTEAFAAEAALAIENARLFEELRKSNTDLTDALERQTATADVLRIIASSPSALDRVFDALAERAVQLCDGAGGVAYRVDGDVLRIVAFAGDARGSDIAIGTTRPITPQHRAGRAILEGRIVHVEDIGSEQSLLEFPENPPRQTVVHGGSHHGATVVVPMLRDGVAIGAMTVSRDEPRRFSEQQIALLETFADQAVIAIENARLFQELEQRNQELQESNRQVTEALEQQTALGEVLRVIASSPTDLQTVIDTIAATASRLCGSDFAVVQRRVDDYLVSMAMHAQPGAEAAIQNLREMQSSSQQSQGQPGVPLMRGSASWVALLDRTTVHIEDTFGVKETYPHVYAASQRLGQRTFAATPLLHGDEALGVLAVSNYGEPRPFTERQIRLLEMFADQAVIAIQNARLFDELAQRNRELNDALERQTATAEIQRVMATSPTDLQRVLDTVAESAMRLCESDNATISGIDGDQLPVLAIFGDFTPSVPAVGRSVPMTGTVVGRAIEEGRTIHIIDILDEDAAVYGVVLEHQSRFGFRSMLATPLLREGRAVGAILLRRNEVRPFSAEQIRLLETFADQAVIAMENARLFEELEQRNAELSETLEQQTALAEVLRVIATSPTDLDKVLQAIIDVAAELCDADGHLAQRRERDGMLAARVAHGKLYEILTAYRRAGQDSFDVSLGISISPQSISGRAFLERRTIAVGDVANQDEFPEARRNFERNRSDDNFRTHTVSNRSQLAVPLLRRGEPIGVLLMGRVELRPFSDREITLLETFADQAVIAIENARLFQELDQRNRELGEALEQQTVTAEVLRVIASSPTDLSNVLNTIVESAARLCQAHNVGISRVVGNEYERVANLRRGDGPIEVGRRLPLGRGAMSGRAILEKRTLHIHDLQEIVEQEYPIVAQNQREREALLGPTAQLTRSLLMMPLLREGTAIGTLAVSRTEVRPFTEGEITLLEMFADQAAIAIENTRLFEELEQRNAELQESNRQVSEALERQTATSEILRTIAGSPNDLDAVFETVARNAARVCGADDAVIHRVVNGHNHVVAHHGPIRSSADARELRPISRDGIVGLVVLDRQTIHILDAAAVSEDELPMLLHRHRQSGQRTTLATPMLLQGEAIGSIMIRRLHVEAFTDHQIAALEAFASQAVIAIENARLFEELEQRNAELQESNRQVSEALEQQTVTAEVLRVIASSPTDKTKVLEAISSAAARLTESDGASVLQLVGDRLQSVAAYGSEAAGLDRWRASTQGTGLSLARPLTARTVVATAFRERRTIHVPDMDIAVENEYPDSRDHHRAMGHRSQVVTPLLREGEPIGVLVVQNYSSRPFTEQQVALVESFANQAVIAIENTRLFEELQESTARLKRSVDELEALGEVSQAVSSSLDLQEVLTTILTHAVELSMSDGGTVYAREDETGRFRLRAAHGMSQALANAFDANDRAGLTSPIVERVLAARAPVSIPSIADDDRLIERGPDDPVRIVLQREGFKSVLGLPLLRDDRVLGALVIRRKTTGEFPPSVVELLQTLASQSALAIQNARLFQEVEAKSRELQVASQHKSQFLANMSHELRTPLNAVIGYSEMLQEELDDLGQDALVPDVEKINAAGRHLLGLINDILDLSKIEAGKMELFIEPVDVVALVHDVTATVGPLIAKNGNQIQVDVAADTGDMQADATKLRQILFNLLGNAAKFTDRGAITLTVVRESADWLVFTVADTGIGMTEEQLGRLFQAFTQAEASTTRSFGGTGLGLTLVRHFAEMMGGAVMASSTPGTGSIFTVRLPAVVTTPEQRALVRDVPARDDADGTPPEPSRPNAPLVLVIDDDATSRDLLRRHLEADGVSAVEAASGEEGLRLARQLQPSLITLDVLMPGMDGWAVLGALKGNPATGEIPVILLTILDDRDLGYALGAADYLTKPIDRDRLLRAVAKHVRQDERGTARRALIVEDDPATRDMLRRLLKREGWSIEEAANGRIGLELVTAAPPDLILLDLMMPELDGFGFVELLRAEPAWRTIPVLVITAKDLTAQERLRLNGWVEQVIQKGAYSRSDLLAEVRALVRASVEKP